MLNMAAVRPNFLLTNLPFFALQEFIRNWIRMRNLCILAIE